jgi:murein DD-endopeptidase MepM/ murein hydrolase activator NlpD
MAINYGLNQDTIVSLNGIANSRLLQIGRVLRIPNQDGIFHTVTSGENLISIVERYNADREAIIAANELFSDYIAVGTNLFIPGARLDWTRLQEINGDLFIRPVNGVITSFFGWRRNPFNRNLRQFHNGIDIRGNIGTPVRAAMAGRISAVGWDNILGHYIIINHHSGYRTLYGHLNVIRTRVGANVAQGERIGDVGNSGQSTGPHLHFTVFRHGVAINPLALMQ